MGGEGDAIYCTRAGKHTIVTSEGQKTASMIKTSHASQTRTPHSQSRSVNRASEGEGACHLLPGVPTGGHPPDFTGPVQPCHMLCMPCYAVSQGSQILHIGRGWEGYPRLAIGKTGVRLLPARISGGHLEPLGSKTEAKDCYYSYDHGC